MTQPYVYVIHLKERTDRKKQFQEAWTAAGLPTEHLRWFPAVRGVNLSNTEIGQFHTHAKSRKARAGRVGCYCSHVKAIEQAIQLQQFPLLILEDDSLPVEPMDLQRLFSTAPTEANLLYFGALPVRKRKTLRAQRYCHRKTQGSASSKRRGSNALAVAERDDGRYALPQGGWSRPTRGTQLYGGHAYGFRNATAAQDVLALLKEKPMTFDSLLVRYQKLHPTRVAVHCPFRFFQGEGYSNIEGMFLERPF
jgi:hypothetical protein